jgi:hypothetical protein
VRAATALLALVPAVAGAQSLEPRLYVPLPVGMNVVVASYAYSSGEVVVDAALPISDFTTTMHSGVAAFARTFGLVGRSAQVQVVLPFVSGMARAVIAGQDTSRELQGPADPQLRVAVNLLGGPARRRRELAGVRFGTIVGVSLTVTAPLGTYNTARRLNVGANRWSLKPELGVVQPIGRRWALEGYGGVWLFSDNSAYADTSTLTQEPLWAFQGHLIRILGRRGWVALDGTWVSGGATSVDGVVQNTFQRNTRLGATAAWSLGRGHVIKGSFARGVYTRYGGDFSVFSVGYQYNWGG